LMPSEYRDDLMVDALEVKVLDQQPNITEYHGKSKLHKCSKCDFQADHQKDLLAHKVLKHNGISDLPIKKRYYQNRLIGGLEAETNQISTVNTNDMIDDEPIVIEKKSDKIKYRKKYKCKKCEFITTDKQDMRLHYSLTHQN